MSASDAAPLPRLGEVFFDVRGNSRSMRLSWYADTDVAVFSIWQGGKCTGTFRLPMGDLDRMIEILQRGPDGRDRRGVSEHGVSEHGGRGYADSGYGADYEAEYNGGYDADYTVAQADYADAHNAGPRNGPGSQPDYGPGEYGAGEYGYPDRRTGDYRSEGYGPGDYGAGSGTGGGLAERYVHADYRPPGQAAGVPRPAYRRDDSRYQADVTGQRSVPDDGAGYGQERFVPPYVRSQADSSEHGYLDDSEYRLPADPATRSRHSAGRHGGRPAR